MSCCIGSAICVLLVIASVAGVALGYNYSMAEYVQLRETNVSVFLKRGVFDDVVVDEMDWRRGGGGPPAAERSGRNSQNLNPERRDMKPSDTGNANNYPGDSAFEPYITPPSMLSSFDNMHQLYEGSLLKLTGIPGKLDAYESPKALEQTSTEGFRRLMQNIDSGPTSAKPAASTLTMTLTIGEGIATRGSRIYVFGGNGGSDIEVSHERETTSHTGRNTLMNEEEMQVIQKLLDGKRKLASEQVSNQWAKTSRMPTSEFVGNFPRSTEKVVYYKFNARRVGGGEASASANDNKDVFIQDLDPPKWYVSKPILINSPQSRSPLVPAKVYQADIAASPSTSLDVPTQPILSQEEFRRAMMGMWKTNGPTNSPSLEHPTWVQEDTPLVPKFHPERTKPVPKFMKADNDVDAIMQSEKEYYDEEEINGAPNRKKRKGRSKIQKRMT